MSLANSKVMQKLGGVVVSSPAAAQTLFDQAIQETGLGSVENALSAFDAQVSSSFLYNRSEREFNNLFIGGGTPQLTSNTSRFSTELAKQSATGARFAARTIVDYNRNSSPANVFGSTYDAVNQLEFRQPLMRGRGTAVNRIAGPNAVTGQYNGVLIRRINSDISLSDFQAAVRDLVRDVENNYWELYFAYRDLDTKLAARESSRATWENRKLRFENGLGRPDDEAQARAQYFNFNAQAKNALAGALNGQSGVLGAERNLRRLMGISTAERRLIRPVTDPVMVPVSYDWQQSQHAALENRIELNRQKWTIRRRELELLAAKQLNKWQFDFVGQYGFRGFGDNLIGSRDRDNGGAFTELFEGNLDDWQLGIELGGSIGNRAGHVAIRNAELNLVRERAILKEQQRQIIHDLSAAWTEVDRALENMKTTFNSRIAAFDELEPKRKRVEEGQDQVFFLLDAQQRTATAESAVHRAVADYNQAIANYAYTSGDMLSRFNISLTEGPWNQSAHDNAVRKAAYWQHQSRPDRCNDLPLVSSGAAVQ
jgi:outer membrane protein TolC